MYFQFAYTDFLGRIVLKNVTTHALVVTMSMVRVSLDVNEAGWEPIVKKVCIPNKCF